MAKTLIIFEGELDEPFIKRVLSEMRLQDAFKFEENDFQYEQSTADPNPEKPTKLIKTLKTFKESFVLKEISKVVIVRDLDKGQLSDTLQLVNNALIGAYATQVADIPKITEEKQFVTLKFKENKNDSDDDAIQIPFACYIIGVYVQKDGVLQKQGETDDILKKIAVNPSNVADCINSHLPTCLNNRVPPASLDEKKLTKLWVYNYQRFDDPNFEVKNYRFDAEKMINREPNIFDFNKDIPELNELKKFLSECV